MQNWKEQVNVVRDAAKQRLMELTDEANAIYGSFPDLRPRERKGGRRYSLRATHWTQRPENRDRVRASLERMNAGMQRKLNSGT